MKNLSKYSLIILYCILLRIVTIFYLHASTMSFIDKCSPYICVIIIISSSSSNNNITLLILLYYITLYYALIFLSLFIKILTF